MIRRPLMRKWGSGAAATCTFRWVGWWEGNTLHHNSARFCDSSAAKSFWENHLKPHQLDLLYMSFLNSIDGKIFPVVAACLQYLRLFFLVDEKGTNSLNGCFSQVLTISVFFMTSPPIADLIFWGTKHRFPWSSVSVGKGYVLRTQIFPAYHHWGMVKSYLRITYSTCGTGYIRCVILFPVREKYVTWKAKGAWINQNKDSWWFDLVTTLDRSIKNGCLPRSRTESGPKMESWKWMDSS